MYFKKTIEWFNNINIRFREELLIDGRIDENKARKYIEISDVVYLMGGEPYIEMENIKKYNLIETLNKKEGIIIGVSAGSMNQASKVVYKDDKIISYDGLGLTSITIYPHLDFKNHDFLKEVFEVSKEKEIIALPEDSFIRIENNIPEYIGEYYPVENKTIEYKGKDYEEIKHLGTIELETERLLLRRTKIEDIEDFFICN